MTDKKIEILLNAFIVISPLNSYLVFDYPDQYLACPYYIYKYTIFALLLPDIHDNKYSER